jgi:bacillolysin
MPERFSSIHFNAADADDGAIERAGARPMARRTGRVATEDRTVFESEEAAARFYLSNVLAGDSRPSMRSLTAPDSPQVVPDLKLRDSKHSRLTDSSTLRFVQTKAAVPIFGSSAVVELDDRRELLSIDAQLVEVGGVSPIAAISENDALAAITGFTKAKQTIDPASLAIAPEKVFWLDEEKDQWHLAWYIRDIPTAPASYFDGLKSHGHGRSIAMRDPHLDYLVDAHDGTVLLYWSSSPTMIVECSGKDEDGLSRIMYGLALDGGGGFALKDTLRRIQTLDFKLGNIDTAPPPTDPVTNPSPKFDGAHTAAVSAHYNAGLVSDFMRSVLMRDGVDDRGMEIISYINCTSPSEEAPPQWTNAAWWKKRMWYGQTRDNAGKLRSFARHLDIIAHELAHGITEHTADLAYMKQSGALNESFSDIFGVIIKNWDWAHPQGGSTSGWDWDIGRDLGHGGRPLRDMEDPSKTGDPAHMRDYSHHPSDNYGVHTNSNIHNKAAYNLMTAKRADGTPLFTPRQCAVLYYLTLSRLDRLATFSQTRATLLNVASTYFLASADRQQKLEAIRKAYSDVGID